jgi:hypothetical protein
MQRHLVGLTPLTPAMIMTMISTSFCSRPVPFAHPSDVLNNADLTLSEKRAILASWASDACAVEAAPALRRTPRSSPVKFDDIMEALRELDQQAQQQPHYRRVLSQRRPGVFRRKYGPSEDRGQSLN